MGVAAVLNTDMLQYGALGLLALVLGAGGAILREYLKGITKAKNESDTFIRQLVESSLETQKENIAALQSLNTETTNALREVTAGLAVLQTVMEHHETAATARHEKIMRTG